LQVLEQGSSVGFGTDLLNLNYNYIYTNQFQHKNISTARQETHLNGFACVWWDEFSGNWSSHNIYTGTDVHLKEVSNTIVLIFTYISDHIKVNLNQSDFIMNWD